MITWPCAKRNRQAEPQVVSRLSAAKEMGFKGRVDSLQRHNWKANVFQPFFCRALLLLNGEGRVYQKKLAT